MNETPPDSTASGIRAQPFAPTADPAFYFAAQAHNACLQRIRAGIDAREGVAVVLGGYGTGKTMLLRELAAELARSPSKYCVAVLGAPMPSWSSFELLEAIVVQFGLDPGPKTFVAYMDALNRFLIGNRDRVVTLLVDDAQNLNKRGQLEMLRLAQNLEDAQHKLLNIVLFAQLDWTAVLKAAPGFAQCITASQVLEPFPSAEVKPFIEHRLKKAGASTGAPTFDDGAIAMIQAYAEGNPRRIVTLCRNALALAEQSNTRRIGQPIVLQAIESVSLLEPERKERATVAALLAANPQSTALNNPAVGAAKPTVPAGAALATAPAAKSLNKDKKANEMLLRAARARQSSS